MPTKQKKQAATSGATGADAIRLAARRWKVPLWILAGVKLVETGSDSGIGSVSSANAQGPFQFIPSTAAAYNVDVNDFSSSAEGAAHYLHDLHREHGSWEGALQAYSGGGYGVGEVEAKLREFGLSKRELKQEERRGGAQTVSFFGDLKHGLDKAFGWSLGGVLGGAKATEGLERGDPGKLAESLNPLSALGPITDFFSLLSKGETWIRLGEVLAGAILVYLGIKALTGQGVSDLPGAKAAVGATPLAGTVS